MTMTGKMTIARERITPEYAKFLLETNTEGNRNISVRRVQMYEHDMLSGAWMDNGETIKIDKEGRLIDGQHRLKAIMLSGVTLWLWVARGVPNDAFDTIDVGFTRTPRQIFKMSGDALKANRTIAALAGVSLRILKGISKGTPAQLSEFVEYNRENLEWLYDTVKNANHAPSYFLLAAVAMHLHGIPDTEINWFVEGAMKSHFDPAKPAHAFKHCVQAEQMRIAARSFTVDNFRGIMRCAYSYVNSIARLTQKEDCYPIKMTDQYKIVKRDDE